MTGSDRKTTPSEEWYILRDEATDQPVGYISDSGDTRDADAATTERVYRAFQTHLLVQDGNVVEELGMCFDRVCSIGPADPEHDQMVLRNLGALTGLRPEAQQDPGNDDANTEV